MTNTEKWLYFGDVNPEYGGAWFDLSDWDYGYVNCVRVDDLDSGCGFTGAVCVERLTIIVDNEKQTAAALQSCGWTEDDLPEDETARRQMIAEALLGYGHYDPVEDFSGPHCWTLQLEEDGPLEFDGWKAELCDDLQAFVDNLLD